MNTANTVYKSTRTEYYTRSTKSHGDRACSHRVVSWTAVINGRVVEGFSTRRAALKAANKASK